jgi:hypothetical protein
MQSLADQYREAAAEARAARAGVPAAEQMEAEETAREWERRLAELERGEGEGGGASG